MTLKNIQQNHKTAIEILNILQQGILYCLMIYYFVKKVISIGSFRLI